MQRKRKKRDKPEELTPAAGNSIPQAILDGSDETNLFKTSPTEKNFNSGVGEKESKTEYYPLYSVSHIGRGGGGSKRRRKAAWLGSASSRPAGYGEGGGGKRP
uniref:Uncharacterized protein n=2 Tax=Oryza sativa subsp. japonica TaxID=39947 RepID=Q69S09_ORYSJ|nr:hypothetical protein [Oryza sativa Japonica Group]BAD30971.1 hypothetical protein [Oryza sativa Japonica Group]